MQYKPFKQARKKGTIKKYELNDNGNFLKICVYLFIHTEISIEITDNTHFQWEKMVYSKFLTSSL